MGQLYLPPLSPLAKAARGWPSSPNVKGPRFVVDWSNSINRGLVSRSVVDQGVNSRELVDNGVIAFWSDPPGDYVDREGKGLHFNETRNAETILLTHLGQDWLHGKTDVTMFCRAKLHGGDSTDEDNLLGLWSDAQGTLETERRRIIHRYDSTSNQIDIFIWSTSDAGASYDVSIEDGEFHDFAWTYDGTTMWAYLDGQPLGTGLSKSGPIGNGLAKQSSNAYLEVMGGHNSTRTTTDSPRFDLHQYGVWDRALSASEIAALSRDTRKGLRVANQSPFLVGVPATGGAYQLDVTAGSLTLTGGTITAAKGSKLNVTAGDLSLTGGTVTASKGSKLNVTAGSLVLSGGTVSLTADRKLQVTAGALELDGQTVTLTYTPVGAYQLDITPGSLTLTGGTATFTRDYALQATAGNLSLTGGTVTMTSSGAVTLADVYSLLEEIHAILGLTAGSPMTVTPTSRTAGSISQTISGDGVTSTTVTRDP